MPTTKLLSPLVTILCAWALLLPTLALGQAKPTSHPGVDAFFARFTDEWVRADPDLATGARYFSGEEQSQLEQQLTPRTRAYTLERIKRARRGLAELQKFDRSKMSE